jgi:hypothetical protein
MIRGLLTVIVLIVYNASALSQSGGFYPEQDTVAEVEQDYVPTVKA